MTAEKELIINIKIVGGSKILKGGLFKISNCLQILFRMQTGSDRVKNCD